MKACISVGSPRAFLLAHFFFFNDPAPPEISPLSLPDALPISSAGRPASSRRPGNAAASPAPSRRARGPSRGEGTRRALGSDGTAVACSQNTPTARTPERSEEHTSELQSRLHLVCRLLLAKKKS